MADERPTLLLTRPEAQSSRFAALVHERFGPEVSVVISPLMEIAYETVSLDLSGVSGLVFTSENAVNAYCRLTGDRSLPAWCVGDRTTASAAAAGIQARSASGDAEALADLLEKEKGAGPFLHLHGDHLRVDLVKRLAPAGVQIRSLQVYRQRRKSPNSQAVAALTRQSAVIVPLFSPRSATLFRESFTDIAASPTFVAISPAVATTIDPGDGERLVLAARPDGDSMLEALADLLVAGSGA